MECETYTGTWYYSYQSRVGQLYNFEFGGISWLEHDRKVSAHKGDRHGAEG